MEIDEFIKHVKSAKSSTIQTAFFGVTLRTNEDHTIQYLYKIDTCSHCRNVIYNKIKVRFKKPVHLTIFQAEMLFAIFCLGKKPADYASYHKTQAGKEFIDNIVEVKKE